MEYHILNGDVLFDQLLEIDGRKIIFRECLIDGPVLGNNLEEILTNRIQFYQDSYNVNSIEYREKGISEILKIKSIEPNSEVNLWFEYDLFCQINFWCSMQFISSEIDCFLVSPVGNSWDGFGSLSNEELHQCFANRQRIEKVDRLKIKKLWLAFKESDWYSMRSLAEELRHLIPLIKEVVEAHIARFPSQDKFGRPEQSLLRIKKRLDNPTFNNIFRAFSKEEGIYGFGDLQLKNLLNNMENQ